MPKKNLRIDYHQECFQTKKYIVTAIINPQNLYNSEYTAINSIIDYKS